MKSIDLPNGLRLGSVAILLMAAVAVGTLPTATKAAETRDAPVPIATKGSTAKISKELATQNALAALPGEVSDVTIEKKHGKMVYVIEIVAAKDGAETDVLIDMDSGKVLGMEH
ncbi:MAG: hypothetical protein QOG23_5019 [Blastocatellia bacterium]|nr:hypothetical protein [Blastocatellia bacterium]